MSTLSEDLKESDERRWKEKAEKGLHLVKHFSTDDLADLIKWARKQGYFDDKDVPTTPVILAMGWASWFEFYEYKEPQHETI